MGAQLRIQTRASISNTQLCSNGRSEKLGILNYNEMKCRTADGNKGVKESCIETNEREKILSDYEIRILESIKDEQVRKRESKNNKENQKHQERKRIEKSPQRTSLCAFWSKYT